MHSHRTYLCSRPGIGGSGVSFAPDVVNTVVPGARCGDDCKSRARNSSGEGPTLTEAAVDLQAGTSVSERKLWLQLLEGSFKLIYKDKGPARLPPPPPPPMEELRDNDEAA